MRKAFAPAGDDCAADWGVSRLLARALSRDPWTL